MDNFTNSLSFVLRWEGGYCNDANDSGGETNRGITHAVYDNYRKSKGLMCRSVRYLEEKEMQEIYQNLYWIPAKCNELPDKLACCHFDWAVNSGVNRATKTLQLAVNTATDGIWGPKSTQALKKALKDIGEARLITNYLALREQMYRTWGVGSQRGFLQGWLNRTAALRTFLLNKE